MGWTKEQEDAINFRGSSLIVSAAAGSGKTSVLVERLIKQLSDSENKIPADRMIVVTFTRDAAAEMKQRLTTALADLISKNPGNQWLSEQQLLLQSARISTIHSFCFELIRDNIEELELSGNFRIMEESEAKLLVTETISEIVTDYYENKPDDIEKLYEKFCYNDDLAIEHIIYDIYDFIVSIPYGNKWISESREVYRPGSAYYDEYCNETVSDIVKSASEAYQMADKCTSLAAQTELTAKSSELLDNERSTAAAAKKLFLSEKMTPAERAALYSKPGFGIFKPGNKIDSDIKEKIKALRENYKNILTKSIPDAAELLIWADEDFKVHYEVLGIISEILDELEKRLWRKKVEKNCIGFSDAESLAIKLLSTVTEDGTIVKTALANTLSDYYKIIMVDEFQDTNNNQDLIFKLISHGGTPQTPGDNLFMVGDVKQSIYRFRLANPKIFIRTLNEFEKYDENKKAVNSFIKLNKNFRSSSDVVNFVNYIFKNVMSEKVGEIVYNSDEELVQGAEYFDRKRTTELAFILSDEKKYENASAVYTANKIASMIKDKVQVDIKENDKRTVRDCTNKDFCILVRRNKDTEIYMKELAKLGIPAYSDETEGYLSSREISVLMNLLRIIDNPLIDTSFVAVMLSAMFMVSDDEMAQIRLLDKESKIYKILCRIVDGDFDDVVSSELKDKVLKIHSSLSELRTYSATMGLSELIRYIYDRTDFISVVRIYDDGERKRANLRILLEYAKSYQESSDEGLSGFLRYIDRVVRINGDFKQAQTVTTSDNVVMIKNIHKSKGLEFPFVFFCESHVEFNDADSKKSVRMRFESGIGFRLQKRREFQKYATLPFKIIDKKCLADDMSESMRLMYVALTRAKERLFIPFNMNSSNQKIFSKIAANLEATGYISTELAAGVNSMSEWLLMALLMHPDCDKLRELSQFKNIPIQKTNFNLDVYVLNASDICEEKKEDDKNEKKQTAPDLELVKRIKDNFKKKYDNSLSVLQAKFSVSEISRKNEDYERELKRPSFIKEYTGMTGSERGTVIHNILQHADFKGLATDVSAEIERIFQKGFITQKQKNEVGKKFAYNFIKSDIFQRVLVSKRVLREKKFLMKISDLELPYEELKDFSGTGSMVQGIIDLYFEEDDGLVLVDYKTDNVQNTDELVEKYKMQLALYKSALEKIEKKKVKQTVIYSLKLGIAVNIEF